MPKKIRVGLLFGGRSVEHEISLLSAKNVAQALDKKKYDISFIKIDKEGLCFSKTAIYKSIQSVDVIFPILHGTFGEDGTIQGLLKLANIPFVGSGVLGSAVCMDKDIMKRILREARIPMADFVTVHDHQKSMTFEEIKAKLGHPFFVKPANSGSSVGIHKVKEKKDFEKALKDAFQYDRKVLIEEYIRGREIECAVLGNEAPLASAPGEIIPKHEFYSYEAKYLDEEGAVLKAPAPLPEDIVKKIQELSIQSYKALGCEGMARVDFFLRGEDEIFVNELNTIPGFTKISMYPRMWEVSGISYGHLIDKLIQLALDRFQKEKKLKTSFKS